jgi:hypothetical protein
MHNQGSKIQDILGLTNSRLSPGGRFIRFMGEKAKYHIPPLLPHPAWIYTNDFPVHSGDACHAGIFVIAPRRPLPSLRGAERRGNPVHMVQYSGLPRRSVPRNDEFGGGASQR